MADQLMPEQGGAVGKPHGKANLDHIADLKSAVPQHGNHLFPAPDIQHCDMLSETKGVQQRQAERCRPERQFVHKPIEIIHKRHLLFF